MNVRLIIKRSMIGLCFAAVICGLIYLFLVPYIKPIKVKGKFIPYEYVLEDNYVTIVRYTGDEEEVIIPEKILFRDVKKLENDEDDRDEYNDGFTGNTVVKKVVIPESVQHIDSAFVECTSLEEVVLPSGLKTIGSHCFACCTALKEISLPEGLETIGWGAFKECSQLEQVVIPASVQEIDTIAFWNCEKLRTVVLPDTVTNVDGSAFAGTPWLEEQTEEFVTAGDGLLIRYNGNETVVEIPENIKYLNNYNFDMKDRPSTETIPGREKIEQIIIPESVEKIYFGTIATLENLTKVVIKNDNVFLEDDFIYYCPNAVIVSRAGSTGQQYAEKFGIPWEELEE